LVDYARGMSGSNEVAGGASRTSAPDAGQERDLLLAAQLVDSINARAPMQLSMTRDLLDKLEASRKKVLEAGARRNSRSREVVRAVLRKIRETSDLLKELAAKKEAEGQVDDGGDVLPSQRDNICSSIDEYGLDSGFRDDVKGLCEALDVVRAAILSGSEHEEAAVFEVSGRLNDLRAQKEYNLPQISSRIAALLAEEFRWVTKQFAQRPGKSNGKEDMESYPGGLSAWLKDTGALPISDPRVQEMRLKDARDFVAKVHTEGPLTLGSMRTSLELLDIWKQQVVAFIACSEDSFREQIREVLRLIKEKQDALNSLVHQKELEGEEDVIDDVFPSQRDNVCKFVDEFHISVEFVIDVKGVCEALDIMRMMALRRQDIDPALMVVTGRMNALKSRTGYSDQWIAGELDLLVAEEMRWLGRFAERLRDGTAPLIDGAEY